MLKLGKPWLDNTDTAKQNKVKIDPFWVRVVEEAEQEIADIRGESEYIIEPDSQLAVFALSQMIHTAILDYNEPSEGICFWVSRGELRNLRYVHDNLKKVTQENMMKINC